MFTKVQEIIRLFTVLDYMAVGMTVGVENTAMAEQALYLRLGAAMPMFIIKFKSFNKVKQPEKCSYWLLKSTSGIIVPKTRHM